MLALFYAVIGETCGYKSFIATVDTLVMGRLSYEKVLSFDPWPYGGLPVIVLSRNSLEIPQSLQAFVSWRNEEPAILLQDLKKKGVEHVYVDGGLTIQRFLQEKLIDEMTLTFIPVLLGQGRSLFGNLPRDIELRLCDSKSFHGGFVQVKYTI